MNALLASKDPMMFGPNITGKLTRVGLNIRDVVSSGSLVASDSGQGYGGSTSGTNKSNINIDASKISSVYGNSSVVQPAALYLLPCVKI